jgi:asparagine N-glycosylation enzyme membrane subunit Stt3
MKEKTTPLLILVLLLVLLALSVRIMSLEHQALPWADPWLHYAVAKTDFVHTHHYSPWNNLSNFPGTGKNWTPPGFYYILLIPYTVMSDNESHLIHFFQLWPILFGTSAVVFIYILMADAFNRKIGFLSAFFLAIVSAASIRSTSGVYRGDVFMVVILILAVYVYLKVYKSSGSVALLWILLEIGLLATAMLIFNGWILIVLVLLSFSFFASLMDLVRKKINFKHSFIFLCVSVPSVVLFYCSNKVYDNLMADFVVKMSLSMLAGGAVLVYTDLTRWIFIRKGRILGTVLIGLPFLFVIGFWKHFSFLKEFLISRSAFFLPKTMLSQQIMELQPVTPSVFLSAYNSLVLMVIFGALLLAVSFIKRKELKPYAPDPVSLCMVGAWTLLSIYLSVTLNRFLFAAAPGICAFSAIAFFYFFHSTEHAIHSPSLNMIATYSVIFLYVLVPLYSSFYTYSSTEPYITPSWEEACSWLVSNGSPDASILTEWDQSNWFQAISERCTVTDTIMAQKPEKAADFFCATPEKGVSYLRYQRIQYVALDAQTVQRFYAMVLYAKDPVPYQDSALCNLYFEEVSGLELVFRYEDLKLFKVTYEKALVTNFTYTCYGTILDITVYTYNPLPDPVDLNCSLTIRTMESQDISTYDFVIEAAPGSGIQHISLNMPQALRFFVVLKEGQHASLTRAVFLR